MKNVEYKAYRKDGRIDWVEEDTTRAVLDTSGKLLSYDSLIQNISKRKQESEALKRQLIKGEVQE